VRCRPCSRASRSQEQASAGQERLAYTLGGRILAAASSGRLCCGRLQRPARLLHRSDPNRQLRAEPPAIRLGRLVAGHRRKPLRWPAGPPARPAAGRHRRRRRTVGGAGETLAVWRCGQARPVGSRSGSNGRQSADGSGSLQLPLLFLKAGPAARQPHEANRAAGSTLGRMESSGRELEGSSPPPWPATSKTPSGSASSVTGPSSTRRGLPARDRLPAPRLADRRVADLSTVVSVLRAC
jgi:hypothetical protein